MSALEAAVAARIREAAGARGFDAATASATPHDVEHALSVVRVCAETRTPFTVHSASGERGAAPAGGVRLRLHALHGLELRAASLTLRAEVGATVEAVRAAAAQAQLAVVGLGARTPATVGGLIAAGAIAQRGLCGVRGVLATGEEFTFGGGVLKDVVGYDVAALLLGSAGRLAVVLDVTFRLEPAAARTTVDRAPGVATADSAIARAFDPWGLLQSSA